MPGSLLLLDRIVAFAVASLFILIGFIYVLKLVEVWMLHRSFRDALQRDPVVASDLINRLDASERKANRSEDDRTGLLLVATGLALFGFTVVVSDPSWFRYGVGSAFFPIFTGLVLIGRHAWLRRTASRDAASRN